MRIRVKNTPPVAEELGITKGREFEVLRTQEGRNGGVLVKGDTGEVVLLLRRRDEYEVIENEADAKAILAEIAEELGPDAKVPTLDRPQAEGVTHNGQGATK